MAKNIVAASNLFFGGQRVNRRTGWRVKQLATKAFVGKKLKRIHEELRRLWRVEYRTGVMKKEESKRISRSGRRPFFEIDEGKVQVFHHCFRQQSKMSWPILFTLVNCSKELGPTCRNDLLLFYFDGINCHDHCSGFISTFWLLDNIGRVAGFLAIDPSGIFLSLVLLAACNFL